jgi:lipoyl(octanoyl) transferase
VTAGGPAPASASPGPRALDVRRLGRVPYAEGLALQERLVAERQAGRTPDTLLLLEHDPVFTLGRNAQPSTCSSPSGAARAGLRVFETGAAAT